MLVLFILYMIFFAAIYAVELAVKYRAAASGAPVVKANILRVTEPLKVIAALFAVTVIELIVHTTFGTITLGFVRACNIFFGVAAAIYAADYLYEQIRLRGSDRVLINAPFDGLAERGEGRLIAKTRVGCYARRYSLGYINLYSGEIIDNKRAVVKKIIIASVLLAVIFIAGVVIIVNGSDWIPIDYAE